MTSLNVKDKLANTVNTYKKAYGVKRHNEVVRGFAPYLAREMSKLFMRQYALLDDGNFSDTDLFEAFESTREDMTRLLEYFIYKGYIGGQVVECNKLGIHQGKVGFGSIAPMQEAGENDDIPDTIYDSSLFNLENPRAVEYARKRAAEAISEINETTRREVRKIIAEGLETGMSPAQVAQRLADKFVQFAVPRPGKRIPNRATLIAVTEMANAYCSGSLQLGQELQQSGIVMVKHWLTVGDDRVSDGCRQNEKAGWIPINDAFPSGHQRPPRFPGCRCDLLTDMKGFEQSLEQMKGLTQIEKEEVGYPDWSEWANQYLVQKTIDLGDVAMRDYEDELIGRLFDDYGFSDAVMRRYPNLIKCSDKWYEALSEEKINAIRMYTGESATINGQAGGWDKIEPGLYADEINDVISELDDAIGEYVTDEDIVVKRILPIDTFKSHKVGDIVQIQQFVSTTVLNAENVWNQDVAYIYVPANVGKGAYLGEHSLFPSQCEYLIGRDQFYLLVNKQVGENGNVYYLRLL